MVISVILWTQKEESESRTLLRGIFGHKREKVSGGWC